MKKEFISTLMVIVGIFVFMFVSFSLVGKVFPFKYKNQIQTYAAENNLQEELVASIIFAESRFDKNAKSNKGAIGLMQLMPSTAKSFYESEDNFDNSILFEVEENIKIGTKYLRYLFDKYQDELTVLACYNAGETNVRSWIEGGEKLEKTQILYKETWNYVEKVQKHKKLYKIYFWFSVFVAYKNITNFWTNIF